MNTLQFSADTAAEPLFLNAGYGQRFVLYHRPHPARECRGGFIYLHPFGDEMNKSRRMAALQARQFAAKGIGVLQIDLFGCGDSSGEFRDANWETWKEDLELAHAWLRKRLGVPVGLWGLRIGALLALDYARNRQGDIESIILWQPVISGASFINQLLRMRLVNEALEKVNAGSTENLRNMLEAEGHLEVAGYQLASRLTTAIDRLKLEELVVTGCPVHWFESMRETGHATPPGARRVAEQWKEHGVDVRLHPVPCLPFWATQEITECPSLLLSTANIFEEAQP